MNRRTALEKEHFLEGTRQKWAGIFTVVGLIVMVANGYGFCKDAPPFLSYFTGIGITFILGASANALMQTWRSEKPNGTTPAV